MDDERWRPNTRRAYAADWRSFVSWAEARGSSPLPADPALVALYLSELASQRAWPTIVRHRAAIARAHLAAGVADPTPAISSERAWARLRRASPTRELTAPLTVPVLVEMVSTLARDVRGERDRTVLLVGFTGAYQRSELVAVDVDDLIDQGPRRGFLAPAGSRTVAIVRGRGRTCPVRAIQAWRKVAHVDEGPLFRAIGRSGDAGSRLGATAITGIVKQGAARIGLDPAGYSSRSLRAGFIHAALAAGVAPAAVARQAGLGRTASIPDVRFTSRDLVTMGL